jgi:quercetin dioxygenase-like cupin family protein
MLEVIMLKETLLAVGITLTVVGNAWAQTPDATAAAPKPTIKRTPLQTTEVPSSTYKSTMGMGELPPTVCSGKHYHPGVEMTYVLDGEVILSVEGSPDVTYKAGDSFQIPFKVVHEVRNPNSDRNTKLLSTWIWEKDKPMSTAATATAPTTAVGPKP